MRVLSTSKKKHRALRKTWMAFCGCSPFKHAFILIIWTDQTLSDCDIPPLCSYVLKNKGIFRISIHFIISNGSRYVLSVALSIAYKVEPTKNQKAKKDNIHVKTCSDPVAVKTYEDLKALLESKYPGRFTYSHEIYPLPFWRDVLSLILL